MPSQHATDKPKLSLSVISIAMVVAVLGMILLRDLGRSEAPGDNIKGSPDLCAEATSAAHDIAMSSSTSDQVIDATQEVNNSHRYPDLDGKAIGNIGAIVALTIGNEPPDLIAKRVDTSCRLGQLKQQLGG